jgi:hypothetical protein
MVNRLQLSIVVPKLPSVKAIKFVQPDVHIAVTATG